MSIKSFLKSHPAIMDFVACMYNLTHMQGFLKYRISGKLHCKGAFLRGCKININGNSKVEIGRMARLRKCVIGAYGDNCEILLGGGSTVVSNSFFGAYDNGSKILIGPNFTMEGGEIASTEGSYIEIGEDCMLSSDLDIRNGDSHAILDESTFQRTNSAKPIVIGNRVWIAAHARVLKGVHIADGCIIGNSAVVVKDCPEPHSVYCGNPAKLVKKGILWDRQRKKYI